MPHDATKVLLGSTGSSDRVVTCEDDDPATYPAGLAVRKTTDGTLSLTAGTLCGVSLGASLSDHKKTAVCREGNRVPLRLRSVYATGEVEITNVSNLLATSADTIEVAGVVFTAQAGAATLGQATFRAATGTTETAASLAAQINAHATSSALVTAVAALAVVTITAKSAGEDGNEITLVYVDTPEDSVGATVTGSGTLEDGDIGMDTVAIGAPVYVDDVTGEGVDAGDASAAATGAFYVSGVLTGVNTDGTTVPVALIDMVGGL